MRDEEDSVDNDRSPIDRGDEAKKEFRDVDISLLDTLDTIEDPNVSQYMYHEMKTISDKIIRSMRIHNMMHIYATKMLVLQWRRSAADMDKMLNTLIQGKTIYIRVLDLHESRAGVTSGSRDEVTPGREEAAMDRSGHTSEAAHDGEGQDHRVVNACTKAVHSSSAQARRHVLEHIKRIVSRYTNRSLEPFPYELAFDVTYYAAYKPLIVAARTAITQMQTDLESYVNGKPPARDGYAGTPTKEALQPLPVDDIAKEIASHIKREIFSARTECGTVSWGDGAAPDHHTTDQTPIHAGGMLEGTDREANNKEDEGERKADEDGAVAADMGMALATDASSPASIHTSTLAQTAIAQFDGLRVCIGVATTPMLAKIACDVEVATLLRGRAAMVLVMRRVCGCVLFTATCRHPSWPRSSSPISRLPSCRACGPTLSDCCATGWAS